MLWDMSVDSVSTLPLFAGACTMKFSSDDRLLIGDVTGGVHCYNVISARGTVALAIFDAAHNPSDVIAAGSPWSVQVDWSPAIARTGDPVDIAVVLRSETDAELIAEAAFQAADAPVHHRMPALTDVSGLVEITVTAGSEVGPRRAASRTVPVQGSLQ
jgi:hypothetical protein